MDESAFSYAGDDDPWLRRTLIRALEVATGRDTIKRLYVQHRNNGWNGESFFATAVKALSLDLRYDREKLLALPKQGPLLVVANHPFGVLDGIIMCSLLEQVRDDFLALTNAVLLRAPEMRGRMLPIDFSETREARRANAASRAKALKHLTDGGCMVIFPAGAMATSPDRFGARPAEDLPWTPFVARLAQAAKGPVAPFYFHGQNSRLFQIFSHINANLRLSLFFHEVRRRIGTEFPIGIGDVVPWAEIEGIRDRVELVAELRRRTLALAQPRPR